MGIAEKLEQNKGLAFGVVGFLVVVCGIFVISQLRSEDKQAAAAGNFAFFSDDDGKTVFADDANKSAPFTHDGKPAAKAYCFTTDGGKTHWVGYLERYNADGKKALDSYRARPIESQDPMDITRLMNNATEVKTPGAPEMDWTRPTALKKYQSIVTPKAPNGSDNPQPYTPTGPNSK